ncbi:MAG: M20/M25/M40 family metallo-hydrolase [Clostridia bacterium]|nr:M20/M25/M40 family metallo-hydrolase [Clostridia bacterium]
MENTELKKLITELSGLMSISGFTSVDGDRLKSLLGDIFDECESTPAGNYRFVKRCGRENARKILIDTHFDEIGMMVTGIRDGGFLNVINIGGLDTAILQAGEVTVYGKDENGVRHDIYGVVASTPPHLRKPGDAMKLRDISEILIDTGYPVNELGKFVSVGTPVGFRPVYSELKNGFIAGKAFDDKACAACAAAAIAETAREDLIGDVILQLSNFEEAGGGMTGALTGAFAEEPDCALVADVNLGRTPDTKKSETVVVGGGTAVTLSPITDRRLSSALIAEARDAGIKVQVCVAAGSTGTNTNVINLAGKGIPTVDVGLPLKSMHTSTEVISMNDAESLKNVIKLFISSGKIAAEI